MLQCTIVLKNNIPLKESMSLAAVLTQLSFPLLPIGTMLRIAVTCTVLASFLLFFRPLLNGMVRALVLTIRPRPVRRVQRSSGSFGIGL